MTSRDTSPRESRGARLRGRKAQLLEGERRRRHGRDSGRPRRKVIVLGAGLAGLSAAIELDDRGHDVQVIEAQERPGGRVQTLRDPLSPGLYIDAGAMAFSDGCADVLRLAERFAVPYRSLEPLLAKYERSSALFHLRGRRLFGSPGAPVDWPYQLTDEERQLGRWGIIQRYLLEPYERADLSLGDDGLPRWTREADGQCLADLMRERGASDGAIELVQYTFWFGEGIFDVAAPACLFTDIELFYRGQDQLGFVGGTDRLPEAIAAHLGDRIAYGAEVVKVGRDERGVHVAVRRRGAIEQIDADAAVCALPFSVLRGVEMEPALSESKSGCVNGLAYTPVTRVFLEVRNRFWEREGVIGPAYTDLPILRVQEQPVLDQDAAGGRAVLEAHLGGDFAARFDQMTATDRLATTLAEMERVHPGTGAQLVRAVEKSWADDPWARGAYSVYRPGQLTRWLPAAQAPEGRLTFAGEHTSLYLGSMEGAIESGVRAAREIDDLV